MYKINNAEYVLNQDSIMLGLIVAFFTGAAVALLLVIVAALTWFNSQPQIASSKPKDTGFEPFVQPQLPQVRSSLLEYETM